MNLSIIQIWKAKNQIYEGIKNKVFKKEHVEDIAARRLRTCESCPHIDKDGSKCAVPGTKPCCGLCGCSLALKTRSLSSECADEENKRWKAVLTDEEQDKLYEDINYDPES